MGLWAVELPGHHVAVVEGAVRVEMDATGGHVFVGSASQGQLIRGWQGSGVEVVVFSARGAAAGGAAFSPDGETLYWADGEAGVISRIATADGSRMGEIRVAGLEKGVRRTAGRLGELAVRSDGRVLFATDPGNQRVLVLAVADGSILGTLAVGQPGTSLLVSEGRLFGTETDSVSGGGGASMWMADVATPDRPVMRHRWKAGRFWIPMLGVAAAGTVGGVEDLAVDGRFLWLVHAEANAVARLDWTTGKVGAWRVMKGRSPEGRVVGAGLRGLGLDEAAQRLYVAEAGLNAIGVLDAETLNPIGHLPTPGYPYRLAVSPSGDRVACLSREGLRMGDASDASTVVSRSVGGARPMLTVLETPSLADLERWSAEVLKQAGMTAMIPVGSVVTVPGGGGGVEEVPGAPTALTRPLPQLLLPIEVLGLASTREEVSVTLTGLEALRGATLCLTVHGVQYDDKAKVTLNGVHTVSINQRTAKVTGNAQRFGGIGGGFHTLPLEIELPKGVLRAGENLIGFEYTRQDSYAVSGFQKLENRIDDASSGFRVIRLNLKDRNGRLLLGPERFRDDDPREWGPPETDVELAQAVEEGWMLWRGKKPDGTTYRLRNFSGIGLTPLEVKATCADCHAQDGRDLKYYNYSNHSIIARSRIHGLTEAEGRRIAAYIRTLAGAPVVPQARPWNPPFQPGPGLDSRPVYEWAAGAGLDAVVEDPVETYNGIFPGAYRKTATGEGVWDLSKITPEAVRPDGALSMREVPIAMQLLDWNHWLPKVHPMDGYSEILETNAVLRKQLDGFTKVYTNTVARLHTSTGSTNYAAVVSFSHSTQAAMAMARESYAFDRMNHTLKEAQRRYPLMLLPLLKSWEIYMEFGLGDRVAGATCGPKADERSWRVGMLPFGASPNIAGLLETREAGVKYEPRNGHGIGNNRGVTFNYVSSAWYHLQLILDHGNRNPACGVNVAAPFDWPYVMAHLQDLQTDATTGAGITMAPLMYLYLVKAPQIYDTGLGVDRSQSGGWQPYMVMPYYLQLYSLGTESHQAMVWRNVPTEVRARLMEVAYRVWLDKNQESTLQQYFTPVFAHDPNSYIAYVQPNTRIGKSAFASLAERVHFALTWKSGVFDGSLAGFGVSAALQNDFIDWAQSVWPLNGDGTPAPWEAYRPQPELPQR
jgi:DNA-binding beta-propeller fold protein YncE